MAAALLLWLAPLHAGDQPQDSDEPHDKCAEKCAKVCFVDLDGDGFNDNAEDEDLDGIPNEVDPDYVKPSPQAHDELDDFFALDDTPQAPMVDLLTNAQRFCRLRMSVRSLAQSRGAFDATNEFGVGEGIGTGAVMGGVCQGGVCVPH
jgi:hypothetical protein